MTTLPIGHTCRRHIEQTRWEGLFLFSSDWKTYAVIESWDGNKFSGDVFYVASDREYDLFDAWVRGL